MQKIILKYCKLPTMLKQFIKVKIVIAQKFHAGRLTEESAIWSISTHGLWKCIKIIRPVCKPNETEKLY